MATTLIYALAGTRPPAALLREELERARAEGQTFDEAWPFAVGRALRDLPLGGGQSAERPTWQHVFEVTREAWKAAYERAPDVALLDAITRLEDAE